MTESRKMSDMTAEVVESAAKPITGRVNVAVENLPSRLPLELLPPSSASLKGRPADSPPGAFFMSVKPYFCPATPIRGIRTGRIHLNVGDGEFNPALTYQAARETARSGELDERQ